jgi:hypothetical protein
LRDDVRRTAARANLIVETFVANSSSRGSTITVGVFRRDQRERAML